MAKRLKLGRLYLTVGVNEWLREAGQVSEETRVQAARALWNAVSLHATSQAKTPRREEATSIHQVTPATELEITTNRTRTDTTVRLKGPTP